jgi:hypothetical protein
MLYTPSNQEISELVVTCHCGCGRGIIVRTERDDLTADALYTLSLIESSWYAKQGGRIKPYFKRLWKALRGKEYYLTELVLTSVEFQELIAGLNKLCDRRDNSISADGGT